MMIHPLSVCLLFVPNWKHRFTAEKMTRAIPTTAPPYLVITLTQQRSTNRL